MGGRVSRPRTDFPLIGIPSADATWRPGQFTLRSVIPPAEQPSPQQGELPPRFFVLDGVDGCGKSTQARRLVEHLEATGRRVEHLREPGGTREGEILRDLLLDRASDLSPGVEALLFCAARRQLLEKRVAPCLDGGISVVCERFHPSTFAYQVFAWGLPEEELLTLLHGWAGSPKPDLTVILDLPVSMAVQRRGGDSDRIEDRGAAFQERVALGMARYAELCPETTILVDATGKENLVAERIAQAVSHVL